MKKNQDLKLVKDGNIGMGLTCSHVIVNKLGGDITLRESQRGFTHFSFQIPVKKRVREYKESDHDLSPERDHEYVDVDEHELRKLNNKYEFKNLIKNVEQGGCQLKKLIIKKEINFKRAIKKLSVINLQECMLQSLNIKPRQMSNMALLSCSKEMLRISGSVNIK